MRSARVEINDGADLDRYPFTIPAIRALTESQELTFDSRVTFLIGDNGSGKSTLLEAVALALGFNAEGGSHNFRFATRRSESDLHRHLRLARGIRRWNDGYFFRAESYFNVATEIENLDREPGLGAHVINSYGGKSLHEQSHGESFLALAINRFSGHGLYFLDEPEAALSPRGQLAFLKVLNRLVEKRASQLVIATQSPMLLAYPRALIYELGSHGIRQVEYEDTDHVQLTRSFLLAPDAYLARLFSDPDPEEG